MRMFHGSGAHASMRLPEHLFELAFAGVVLPRKSLNSPCVGRGDLLHFSSVECDSGSAEHSFPMTGEALLNRACCSLRCRPLELSMYDKNSGHRRCYTKGDMTFTITKNL